MKVIGLMIGMMLLAGVAFAAPQEEVEAHYQAALKYGNQGMIDEALQELNAVVNADPAGLPETYYKETIREAYFNAGLLYGKKRELAQSIESFKKALELDPHYARAQYYLAVSLVMEGEIAQARVLYEGLRAQGVSGDPVNPSAGDYLKETFDKMPERTITMPFTPLFCDGKSVHVTIKGVFGGDQELLKDTLSAIDRYAHIMSGSFATNIQADCIRIKNDNTLIIEKWVLDDGKAKKEYWVSFNSKPPAGFPYKIMISVSDRETK